MRKTQAVLFLITIAAPLAALSCSTPQRVHAETTLAKAFVSDEQSNQIGDQVHADLNDSGVRYLEDPYVRAYVEEIGARIFSLAGKDRPGVNFHVHVIDDPKTVNAFATPGGHTYVYSGLLLEADNEAEVAGVMAHEAGHVVGRHVERAIVSSYGLQALAAAALGDNPAPAKELAAGLAGTGIMRAHTRSEETEADEYGARYISKLGYDPHAMITFFTKLEATEGRTPRVMRWLSTHPLTPDRISHIRQYIQDNHLRGTNLGEARHHAVQERLLSVSRGVS